MKKYAALLQKINLFEKLTTQYFKNNYKFKKSSSNNYNFYSWADNDDDDPPITPATTAPAAPAAPAAPNEDDFLKKIDPSNPIKAAPGVTPGEITPMPYIGGFLGSAESKQAWADAKINYNNGVLEEWEKIVSTDQDVKNNEKYYQAALKAIDYYKKQPPITHKSSNTSGSTGAKITPIDPNIQVALGVEADGKRGPQTNKAIQAKKQQLAAQYNRPASDITDGNLFRYLLRGESLFPQDFQRIPVPGSDAPAAQSTPAGTTLPGFIPLSQSAPAPTTPYGQPSYGQPSVPYGQPGYTPPGATLPGGLPMPGLPMPQISPTSTATYSQQSYGQPAAEAPRPPASFLEYLTTPR